MTPDHASGTTFNDYIVSNYVDFVFYRILEILIMKLFNDYLELNRRMNSIFPIHPHIFNFITCLRHEHEFQHHRTEKSNT